MSDLEVAIRKAVQEDIDDIKWLADRNRKELGFIIRSSLERSIERQEIIVATDITCNEVVGFIDYHHRRDQQSTIYHFLVAESYRHNGIGKQLLLQLVRGSIDSEKNFLLAKCPLDLDANGFYQQMGFSLITEEQGKRRPLNVWKLSIEDVMALL